jgi:hypothetical protein
MGMKAFLMSAICWLIPAFAQAQAVKVEVYCPPMPVVKVKAGLWQAQLEPTEVSLDFPDCYVCGVINIPPTYVRGDVSLVTVENVHASPLLFVASAATVALFVRGARAIVTTGTPCGTLCRALLVATRGAATSGQHATQTCSQNKTEHSLHIILLMR